jgi:hypothetical protein
MVHILECLPPEVRWHHDVAEDVFRKRLAGGPVAIALLVVGRRRPGMVLVGRMGKFTVDGLALYFL